MRLKLRVLSERFSASLFFVPMIAVVTAVVAGLAGVALDSRLDDDARLPLGFSSTVESARSLLSTIAGATITFAGIAFSISLLIIQLASSQYSPRVVHTLFRDPFNKRVMALVVGTFTYCLIVLRSVRSSLDADGSAVIPNISVAVALLLGIITILAVVAFIDHSAHSMDVSEILDRVRRETVLRVHRDWTTTEPGRIAPEDPPLSAQGSRVVRFDRSGWVQQVDVDAFMECTPTGGVIAIETHAGSYAVSGTPLCIVSPPPAEPADIERRLRAAVAVGKTRTMQQDASYGLRQLADVAVKALSPGVNDPTTAQDAIFHSAAVLAEFLRRDAPPRLRCGPDGRRVITQQPTRAGLVHLAFDETRRAAAGHPAVSVYLLEALHLLRESLLGEGLRDRTDVLVEQARRVVAGCETAGLAAADTEEVQVAFAKWFSEKT